MSDNLNNPYFYKWFICRIGGLPVNLMECLKFTNFNKAHKNYIAYVNVFNSLVNSLNAYLFDLIHLEDNMQVRSKLIDLKRKINKHKNIFEKDVECLNNNELINKLKNYIDLLDVISKIKKDLNIIYNYESKSIRSKFKNILIEEDFQKGLLLSSRQLFDMQKHYINTKDDNGRTAQIERGLMRYFSRTAMKATPYSTFCTVILGSFENIVLNKQSYLMADPLMKKSILKINKDLFALIKDYVKADKELKYELFLKLNKNYEKAEGYYKYLTEINHKEVFQKLRHTPLLEIIETNLRNVYKIKYLSFIQVVAEKFNYEVSKEEIVIYLDKLIEIGFIRIGFEIPEQEMEWVSPLIEFLKSTQNPKAYIIIRALTSIIEQINTYSNHLSKERSIILENMYAILNDMVEQLNIERPIFTTSLVYEDATSNGKVHLPINSTSKIVENVIKYISLTRKVAYLREEQANMRYFFDTFYSKSESKVGLMQFYEDYSRNHIKPHASKIQKHNDPEKSREESDYNTNNPFNMVLINTIHQVRSNISKLIGDKHRINPNASIINISYEELKKITDECPDISSEAYSYTIFSQILLPDKNDDELKLVMPNGLYLPGFGKYYSRFLYLFDSSVKNAIYDDNGKMSCNIIAEISGDDDFNANMHPSLLKYEIEYPTYDGGLCEIPLDCKKITVEVDENDPNKLCLKYIPLDKIIIPIDLGFMSPNMRPLLFQILSKMSPTQSFSIAFPEEEMKNEKNDPINGLKIENPGEIKCDKENPKIESSLKILYRPRVVFENNIIISRRTWKIPKPLLPQLSKDESSFDFYLRVNSWIEDNNIPDEVFVSILPIWDDNLLNIKDYESKNNIVKQNKKDEDNANINGFLIRNTNSRDYHKPQYIDFKNPILVDLFSKISVGLNNCTMTIEERYPDKMQLLNYNGKYYASEQIFQVNCAKK
jgi:hypothetical protein